MSFKIPSGLAVITGASSGIGAVFADRLAARGHPLLIVARRADRLVELKADLEARHGVAVETLTADLESAEDLSRLEARLGASDVAILVNNAGAGGLGPLAQSSADQLERIVRLNVLALSRLSHAAVGSFRQRNIGVLVNIGSIVAFAPSAFSAVYGGSKAYVVNFTRSLQAEYAKTGIRIQLVMPGPVRTEFFSSQGLSDSVFPDTAFISAEALVDASLNGLELGELITTPTLSQDGVWKALEEAREAYLRVTTSGKLADQYGVSPKDLSLA